MADEKDTGPTRPCPHCGQPVPPQDETCPHCGGAIPGADKETPQPGQEAADDVEPDDDWPDGLLPTYD